MTATAESEVDLKRLLHRLQAQLTDSAHSALSEPDALRRWTYVEHAKELLVGLLHQSATTMNDDKEEDVSTRLQLYESKLAFITDFMLASEGLRPALHNSLHPSSYSSALHLEAVTTLSAAPPLLLEADKDKKEESTARKRMLAQEEGFTRQQLLASSEDAAHPTGHLPSEAELRRQLGLGRAAAPSSTRRSSKPEDLHQQLERETKERETVANEILALLGSIRDNSLDVQSSLAKDHSRLGGLSQSLDANSGQLAREMTRMGQLYLATSHSCRASCVMVLLSLCIAFAAFIVLKLTPRPT